ncbi:fatty acid--CoA ligase [Campylobacter sp. RM9344]|uniref:Long-chain-fatty-acid--CoA ligase n=1 Tax=Campylobacter californiensis TaxID=1032243 RepID=A0AAW3ZUC3_9BACT|nr:MULTISPECIES: fatty acid--CoA ligase [unclassified Campylobacter]MBE2984559.1 fatty acid--CoA ligase [Campylobacter sp. RM6883]MBE2987026.1 fatty acid--CoA ligase [Campylobacter sp. RM12919]MBE2988687.1 fatty acid--CoA ligase [Campylobacter sp. RM12920]MBE2995153.1 fatty acid--CoA ligase [Campylobacter sp. RM6913]MBE3029074.1 fatty acid--CoA ligase [Campylobacter sp. RM9344]
MMYKYQNLYKILIDAAKDYPRAVAIFDDKDKLRYGELKACVDKVGAYLQAVGIGFGDRVAMCVSNSQEFIISYLAITAIGAVAVPMNTFLKNEEFSYILKDCDAKILIASSSLSKELIKLNELESLKKIIWIGEIPKALQNTSSYEGMDEELGESVYLDVNLHPSTSPSLYSKSTRNVKFNDMLDHKYLLSIPRSPTLNDIVHIIYTSGTTGKPKGAMINYRNIFSNLEGAHSRFVVKKNDRFIVFLPMFHSFTLTATILLPLYTGASMVLVKSVFPFSNVLKQTLFKRVSVFLGIPAIYTAIGKAKIPWYFRWFNRIRLFVSGAAPLAKQTIDDFKLKFPRATLVEGYGLSECSPIVAANLFDKQKPMSVGLPLDGYEVKIVNDEMMELPVGEIGEIIVRGDCVMQGYLGLPTANDETILNGWLRTGDLGKVDDEGFIYIVDRKKDLIISKGINIYPREIEEVLYKLDEVEAAAVIGVRDTHADEEVVAFIQLKDGMDLDEKAVRAYLKKHLANFKIPKNIYFAEELPRNATGKVLKRVLKEQIKDKI